MILTLYLLFYRIRIDSTDEENSSFGKPALRVWILIVLGTGTIDRLKLVIRLDPIRSFVHSLGLSNVDLVIRLDIIHLFIHSYNRSAALSITAEFKRLT